MTETPNSATPIRFLIIGLKRSGTTVTQHCCNGHPEVSMAVDEMKVDPLFTQGTSVFSFGSESFEQRRDMLRQMFDVLSQNGAETGAKAVGMKLAIGDTPTDGCDLVLALRDFFPDLRILYVKRTNLTAQSGSRMFARKTGRWHRFTNDADKSHAEEKIELDLEETRNYVRRCKSIAAQVESLADTHAFCTIEYERDIEGGGFAQKAFEFLGVSQLEPTWVKLRKSAPPAEQYISNYKKAVKTVDAVAAPTADELAALFAERQDARRNAERENYLISRGSFLLGEERFDEALLSATRVLLHPEKLLRPWMIDTSFRQLELLAIHGHPTPDATWKELQSKYADSPFCMRTHAVRLSIAGQHEAALQELQRAVDKNPELAAADLIRKQITERAGQKSS